MRDPFLDADDEDQDEICRLCGGAGCPYCQGEWAVPAGTHREEEEEPDA